MAIGNLTLQYISASFAGIMQYSSSGKIYDGLGNQITLLNVTASAGGGSGSSGIYNGTSPTTTTVGGIASGTSISGKTFEELFEDLLCPYNTPSFATFTITGQSTTVDVGYILSGSKQFTWTFNFSTNVSASTLDITDTTNSTAIATNISTTSPATYTLASVQKTTAASNVWTVTADPTIGSEISKTYTVAWQWRNYFCASSTNITSDGTAQTVVDSGLVTSQLDTDKSWNVTCTSANNNASNYTYIIYPNSYGALSNIIQNGATPVLTAFTDLGTFNVNNSYGYAVSCRVYQSNALGAFAAATTLAIT